MSQQVNLFNPIFLKQKKYFSAVTMLEGLGLILVGSIAVFVYARFHLSEQSSQLAAATQQLNGAKAQLAKVTAEYAPRQKTKSLEDEVLRAEAEVKSQARALEVVQKGGIGDTQGYSEYLRAFSRQIVGGLWLTGFSIDAGGKAIELRGRALQPDLVPSYINRLKNEKVMRGKTFSNLAMEQPRPENAQGAAPAAGTPRIGPTYVEFTLTSAPPGMTAAVKPASDISGVPRP